MIQSSVFQRAGHGFIAYRNRLALVLKPKFGSQLHFLRGQTRFRRQASIVGLALLVGCASSPAAMDRDGQPEAKSPGSEMQAAAGDAVSQPLRDFGLMKKKIPYALSRIADPYAQPSGPGCAWISHELSQLSAALGADVAVKPAPDQPTTSETGSNIAVDAAGDFIRNASSGLIPGRSIIRQISGASRSDRLYAAALERGMIRRAYLTGLSQARGCS